MDAAIIEKEALQLPESSRALLADHLIQSLRLVTPDLCETWVREADSRMAAYRAGEIAAVDGPAAMAKLRAQFPLRHPTGRLGACHFSISPEA